MVSRRRGWISWSWILISWSWISWRYAPGYGTLREHKDIFFSLVRASKEWKVDKLILTANTDWEGLARSAATGHIDEVWLPNYHGMEIEKAKKEDVRAVWEIVERFIPFDMGVDIVVGGSRAGEHDPKTTWEEAYQNLLKNIC